MASPDSTASGGPVTEWPGPRYHRPVSDPIPPPAPTTIAPAPTTIAPTPRHDVPPHSNVPRQRRGSTGTRKGAAPPVLVEMRRGATVESRHRGHVVMVAASGEVIRAVGSPATEVLMRSTIKPLGLVALIESGAADAFGLVPAELAVMAGSHTGEDRHVRTLQAIFRRASVTQVLLTCGIDGAPGDARTAARLARDGEKPGPLRHDCSGYHAASILMSVHAGWSLEDYADPTHKSQLEIRDAVARLLRRKLGTLKPATDDCGMATYEVTLVELARAYLLLAHPESAAADDRVARSAPALRRIRDAMMSAPDMVGGTDDVLDTELMRRRPQVLVSKSGAEGLRGIGLVAGPDARGAVPAGLAIKIEDGDASRRASRAVAVEALAQAGVLDDRDLRALASYHHPASSAPDGREVATAVPRFELAPMSELTGAKA